MMKHLYGHFTEEQIKNEKRKLHSAIHWLLIYKEQEYLQLDAYFKSLLYKISGLNSLLGNQEILVDILSLLQAAKDENLKTDCDNKIYRKLILDTHDLIDKIKERD